MAPSWGKKRKAMKTTNILKTLILSIAILTATSCRKDEKEKPQPKTYLVECRGTISGTGVTGKMSFFNPEKQTTETEIVIGTSISRFFIASEGSTISATLQSNVTSGFANANLEIYIDNKKTYSGSHTGLSGAYVYVSGIVK